MEILRAYLFFVVKTLQALSLIDNVHFTNFLRVIDPRVSLPCRNTLTNNWLPKMYSEAVAALRLELNTIEWVALTTDIWSSRVRRSYYTVTIHYITPTLTLISRILTTEAFDESHSAINIADRLYEVAVFWKIDKKVVAVVTDNASNMKAAINSLKGRFRGLWRWVSCTAHSINLVVKGSIAACPDLYHIIQKLKDLVGYFNHSDLATAKLNGLRDISKLVKVALQQDVETRWNSTVIMIESALLQTKEITEALTLLGETHRNLEEHEWETLSQTVSMLKIFKRVTEDLSASSYPTLAKHFPCIYLIKEHLGSPSSSSPNTIVQELRYQLTTKMNERFTRFEGHHLVSTYIDPQ